MATLKQTLLKKIEEHRPRTTALVKEHSDVKLGEVTIGQAIGGARGVRCLVTDISYLDPMEGIRFRGKTIPETFAALPKVPGSDYPFVEGFWYFLLTGEVPTMAQTLEVVEDFKARAELPKYVKDVLRAMPRDTHPMTMFSTGILAMQRESVFVKRYNEGMTKMEYWDPMYEDSTTIMARAPQVAAYIYRLKYKNDEHIACRSQARHGRQLRAHDGLPEAVRRRGPDVLHPPLRPRVGQRLRAHHPPGGLGALRRLLLAVGGHERPGRSVARAGQPGSAVLGDEVPGPSSAGRNPPKSW